MACGTIIFLLFAEIKEKYNNAAAWTLFAVHVILLFAIFAVVLSFSTLIRKLIAKRSLLSRCKCLSLIGYGGIALCGIVPRIYVYIFVNKNITWFIFFISFVTSFAIYLIILLPNAKHFEVDYYVDGTLLWMLKHAVVHIIVLIIQIRIAIALFEDQNVRSDYLLSILLREGGVKSRYAPVDTAENTNGAENNTIVEVVKIPESNKVECNICAMEYSERRIPRNLKECGHTVCEVCANELLKKNNQIYLRCPFCQEVTVVKGPANLLPKNFGMLDVIEKMK